MKYSENNNNVPTNPSVMRLDLSHRSQDPKNQLFAACRSTIAKGLVEGTLAVDIQFMHEDTVSAPAVD